MIKKLDRMPYANAYVQISDDGNTTDLWSYRTKVITIKDGWMSITGLYSATTRKHISAFMREYTPFSYYTAKDLLEYGRWAQLNITTGEIILDLPD